MCDGSLIAPDIVVSTAACGHPMYDANDEKVSNDYLFFKLASLVDTSYLSHDPPLPKVDVNLTDDWIWMHHFPRRS